MKIVHICNCLRGGGVQNFLLSLLPEQVLQGHDVNIIVIEKYDYDYCYRLEDILKANGVKSFRLYKKRGSKASMIRTLFKCRALICKLRPDIVNTHGAMSHTFGAFAVLGMKSRQVITIHNTPEKWSFDTKFFCKNKPLIFCSNAAFESRLQESFKMRAIDNGISRSIIHSDEVVDLRKELGLKETDKIIVLVGSLRPQKNYEFLMKIVDRAKDSSLHFCVCGGNYGKGYISTDIFRDYNTIHFLGLRSDVSAIENGADLFLSCAKFEGLPIAVLEAYFNGIPCVLSPIDPHKNISDVQKVWIPKSFDADSFVESIDLALKNACDHGYIYESRKSQIQKYTIAESCLKYIIFYNEVLNAK